MIGALIISLYGYETNTIKTDSISFSTTYSFIIANFFSIPIAFRKSTEQKNKDVPYIGYVFGIMIVLPIILSAIFILINYITRNDSHIPTIYSYFLNYGLLMISIICLIINYVIQIKNLKLITRGRSIMKLERITKKYGQNTVIDDVNFDFANSQIVGLIGKMV